MLVTIYVIWYMQCQKTGNWNFMHIHEEGLDLVFFLMILMNIFIRSWMISMKYGNYPDKLYKRLHLEVLSEEEFMGELMIPTWVVFKPDLVLSEIAASVIR